MSLISKLFEDLTAAGVECRENFTCCQSCGHAELSGITDGSYIFYHEQTADAIMNGRSEIYFNHNIQKKDVKKVIKILRSYDITWDGNEMSSIQIPV
jgi:hypothetical protein